MLRHLFSSDDSSTDSIAVCVVFGVFGLVALAITQVVLNHAQIGITEAGTGIAAVIGAGGAVRVARDRQGPVGDKTTPAAA
jgi:hypothetical protein